MKPYRRWTEQEIEDLKMTCFFKTVREMSEYFGRDEGSIKYKLNSLGIKLRDLRSYRRSEDKRNNTWTKEEMTFIKRQAGRMTSKQIGEVLGKTSHCVKNKASRMGVSLQINPWTEQEIEVLFLLREDQKKSYPYIANFLRRTEGAVRRKYNYLTKV